MLAFFSWSVLVLWLVVTAEWVIAAVMEGPTHWLAHILMVAMLGLGVVLQLLMILGAGAVFKRDSPCRRPANSPVSDIVFVFSVLTLVWFIGFASRP